MNISVSLTKFQVFNIQNEVKYCNSFYTFLSFQLFGERITKRNLRSANLIQKKRSYATFTAMWFLE